jgi:hypothetical protein
MPTMAFGRTQSAASFLGGGPDMDPDACLARLLDALRDRDRVAAWDALEDLYQWLSMGGAMPADPRPSEDDGLASH